MLGRTPGRCGWVSAVTTGRGCVRHVPGCRHQPADPYETRPWPPTQSSGALRTRPPLHPLSPSVPCPAAQHCARASAAPRSRPRGGAPSLVRPQGAPGAGRGSWRPGQSDPAWQAPCPGPHISSPGGRRHSVGRPSPAPAAPPGGRRGDAPWARGAACLGPPFPGSGPAAGGGLSPPRAPEPSHAGRALPLQLPASPRTPGSLVARPRPSQPCVKVPALVAWGSPFSQVCPSRHIRVFQHAEKKMPHARTYLFILQQLQETMKLFKNRGNALSSRAVVFQ